MMQPGELIVIKFPVMCYGVIPEEALADLAFIYRLNKTLTSRWRPTIKAKIRAGDKLLNKNGYARIRMLTDLEIEGIKTLTNAPRGALLCGPRR